MGTSKEVVLVNCRLGINAQGDYMYTAHPLRPDGTLRFGGLLGFTGPSNYLFSLLHNKNPAAFEKMQLYGLHATPNAFEHKLSEEWLFAFLTSALVNTLQVSDHMALSDLRSNTLDFNQWFPGTLQIKAALKMGMNRGALEAIAAKQLRPLHPGDDLV
mmetsp:Transcript_29820/g.83317  ORF Transcript_29820/g.83317 Transcript_29820/m.83317 type:complete len:158 (+) Transcript_29820:1-474(+)